MTTQRRFFAVAAMSVALIASGCSPSSPFDDLEPTDSTATILCESRLYPLIDGIASPRADTGEVMLLDAVALAPAEPYLNADGDEATFPLANTWQDGVQPTEFFSGTLLHVRSGTQVTIEVVDPPESALISWGTHRDSPVTKLLVPACEGEGWDVFTGGVWTDRQRCVELLVTVGEDSESVKIAAGAPCPSD